MVTSAPNGGAWQDFIFRFSSNGGDFHLTFSAHPHPDNVRGFVGLDNVSMKSAVASGLPSMPVEHKNTADYQVANQAPTLWFSGRGK